MIDFYSICSKCGGKCCKDAKPPLTMKRLQMLLESGVSAESIEFGRYAHSKVREDGYCVFFDEKCAIHNIKPETCVAGPFTFDLKGDVLEIYLKKESICPLVRLLRENEILYKKQFEIAVENILRLIQELGRDELEEILKIEEPETEKVAEIKLR